jgi:hypothetical protein
MPSLICEGRCKRHGLHLAFRVRACWGVQGSIHHVNGFAGWAALEITGEAFLAAGAHPIQVAAVPCWQADRGRCFSYGFWGLGEGMGCFAWLYGFCTRYCHHRAGGVLAQCQCSMLPHQAPKGAHALTVSPPSSAYPFSRIPAHSVIVPSSLNVHRSRPWCRRPLKRLPDCEHQNAASSRSNASKLLPWTTRAGQSHSLACSPGTPIYRLCLALARLKSHKGCLKIGSCA